MSKGKSEQAPMKITASPRSSKVRNPDRRNGKGWGRGHNAAAKPAKQRKEKPEPIEATERGSNLTMPKMTWGWVTQTMVGRHRGTHRFQVVESILERQLRRSLKDDR